MTVKPITIGNKLKPLAYPIRSSFDKIQKSLKNTAENQFTEIEKIHGLPLLSKMDIIQVNAKFFDGEFEYMKLGRGIRIKISSDTQNKEFTLLHEIGHVIDNQATGVRGINETGSPENIFSDILKAIEQTDLTKSLRVMQKSGRFEYKNKLRKIGTKDYDRLNYLLQPKELWARAYSQYIAMKSGNKELLKQLNWEENRQTIFKTQWMENDFKMVIFEVEKFLIKNKWTEQLA
jgi:hypothetical protein